MSEVAELLARAIAPGDSDAAIALAAALARAGDPLSVGALRALADDPAIEIRMLVQIALARLHDRDVELVARRLAREPDLGIFAVLAARAGTLSIDARALANLAAQAAYAATPGELRAACTWAVAAHDPALGARLAGALLVDDEAAFWLASIVGRRGGPLTRLVAGLRADPALDRVASLVGS